MDEKGCVAFLQWALPKLQMRWQGFRRVRRQVCRRIHGRIVELGLDGFDAYREFLERNNGEWKVLDGYCQVTISRFFRDRGMWERLLGNVIPELVSILCHRGDQLLRCWCAGSASGEEPYSLVLGWDCLAEKNMPDMSLEVIATEVNKHMLERARRACYLDGSLREIPHALRQQAFVLLDPALGRERNQLRRAYREAVIWRCEDVRNEAPPGTFDIIFCRNLAFTYFSPTVQSRLLNRLSGQLNPGGALIIGRNEALPTGHLNGWFPKEGIFRKTLPVWGGCPKQTTK